MTIVVVMSVSRVECIGCGVGLAMAPKMVSLVFSLLL